MFGSELVKNVTLASKVPEKNSGWFQRRSITNELNRTANTPCDTTQDPNPDEERCETVRINANITMSIEIGHQNIPLLSVKHI